MTIDDQEGGQVTAYHAHVYYEPQTRAAAELVREGLARQFAVRLGRWHDQPVGPHTRPMYQVLFAADQFGAVVPWLMLNRRGLDVLVHPETGDDLTDHTQHALWLGKPLPLRLEALRPE
ncbi:MAG: DOPA 4,5-dioxygenase family protein [Geminicoccaceae bacterium]